MECGERSKSQEFDLSLTPFTLHSPRHRFRKWFTDKELLNQVAGPMIREVAKEAGEGGKGLKEGAKNFTVYSCHDVSLLGILYALKADIVKTDPSYWPDYGSWITFEVWGEEGMRVRLNGNVVTFEGSNERGMVGGNEWKTAVEELENGLSS